MRQIRFRLPDPAGGAYSAFSDFLDRFKGPTSKGGAVMQRVGPIALNLRSIGRGFKLYSRATLHNNLRQVVHTYASVTKQYNLVPVCLYLQPLDELTHGQNLHSGKLTKLLKCCMDILCTQLKL